MDIFNIKYNKLWKLMKNYYFDIDLRKNSDLVCVICNQILVNAHQNVCGCRYCFSCIKNYSKLYCPGVTDDCKENLVDLQNDVHIDHAANKKLSQLIVKCPLCEFQDKFLKITEHLESHVIRCPFMELGCNINRNRLENINDHLIHENYLHSHLLMELIQSIRIDVKNIDENSKKCNGDKMDHLLSKVNSMEEIIKNQNCEINELKLVYINRWKEIENLNTNIIDIQKTVENLIKTIENKCDIEKLKLLEENINQISEMLKIDCFDNKININNLTETVQSNQLKLSNNNERILFLETDFNQLKTDINDKKLPQLEYFNNEIDVLKLHNCNYRNEIDNLKDDNVNIRKITAHQNQFTNKNKLDFDKLKSFKKKIKQITENLKSNYLDNQIQINSLSEIIQTQSINENERDIIIVTKFNQLKTDINVMKTQHSTDLKENFQLILSELSNNIDGITKQLSIQTNTTKLNDSDLKKLRTDFDKNEMYVDKLIEIQGKDIEKSLLSHSDLKIKVDNLEKDNQNLIDFMKRIKTDSKHDNIRLESSSNEENKEGNTEIKEMRKDIHEFISLKEKVNEKKDNINNNNNPSTSGYNNNNNNNNNSSNNKKSVKKQSKKKKLKSFIKKIEIKAKEQKYDCQKISQIFKKQTLVIDSIEKRLKIVEDKQQEITIKEENSEALSDIFDQNGSVKSMSPYEYSMNDFKHCVDCQHFQWQINDFNERYVEAKSRISYCVISEWFGTEHYKVRFEVYPYGDEICTGSHLSVFVIKTDIGNNVASGKWQILISLVDQIDNSDYFSQTYDKDSVSMNEQICFGSSEFIKLEMLDDNPNLLKNNTLKFRCYINIK